MTVLVAVSITDTEPPALPLVTSAQVPSGLTATAAGPLPTPMVAVTVSVAVSITDTELPEPLVT